MPILNWKHSIFRTEETVDTQRHQHSGQRYLTNILTLGDSLKVEAEVTANYVNNEPLDVIGKVTANGATVFEKHFHEVGEAQHAISCMIDTAVFLNG